MHDRRTYRPIPFGEKPIPVRYRMLQTDIATCHRGPLQSNPNRQPPLQTGARYLKPCFGTTILWCCPYIARPTVFRSNTIYRNLDTDPVSAPGRGDDRWN